MKTSKLTLVALLQLVFCITHSFTQIDNNDYFSQADKIDVGKKYTFQLGEKLPDGFRDRRDAYKFDLPGDAAIVIKQTVRNDLLSGVGLYDSDTTWLYGQHCCVKDGTDSAVFHTHLKQGTYYILIVGDPPEVTSYDLYIEYTPPPYANDTEPNNTPDKATKLELSTEVFGHLGYTKKDDKDRKDWYFVDLPEDGYLEIVEKTAGGNLHPLIGLWERNGTKLITAALYDTVYHPRLKAGRYHIELGDAEGPGSYKLLAKLYPTGLANDMEPNDSPLLATKTAFGVEYTGHLNFYKNDTIDREDWYYCETPEDGILKIIMNPNPEKKAKFNILSGIHLLESEGTKLITYIYGKTSPDTLTFPNLQKGKYHIKLVGWGDTYGSYILKTLHTPINLNNDKENNDEASKAVPMLFDKEYTGHLGYYSNGYIDDRDYYVFEVARTSKVQIVETTYGNLATGFWILDSLNRIIPGGVSKSKLNGSDTLTAILSPGKYYINIFKGQFDYGSYSLTLTSVQTGLHASQFAGTIKIAPNPAHQYLKCEVSIPWKEANLTLVNSKGLEVFSSKLPVGEISLQLPELPAGMYFVIIRAGINHYAAKLLIRWRG